MSIYQCSKGHASTESDYCSECGTKIQDVPQMALTVNTLISEVPQSTQTATITCPDCTAPHEFNSGDFCEICGYNFVTGMHGEVPPITIPPEEEKGRKAAEATDVTDKLPAISVTKSAASPSLEIIAIIDPSLQSPESPRHPINHLSPLG